MKKLLCLLLVWAVMMPCAAMAENEPTLSIAPVGEMVRPGKSVLLSFSVQKAGFVDIRVLDENDAEVSVVVLSMDAQAGENQVWWNGTFASVPAAEGRYRMVLTQNGQSAETPVVIGGVAPYLSGIQASDREVTPDQPVRISFYASCDGRITTGLRAGDQWRQLASWQIAEGENSFTWDDWDVEDGQVAFTLMLTDALGTTSNEEQLLLTLSGFDEINETLLVDVVEPDVPGDEETDAPAPVSSGDTNDQSVFTPSYGSPYAGTDQTVNYWTLPMDITDTEAVWNMLIRPVTVMNDGGSKTGEHRRQVVIREEPDEKSKGVGVVTNLTQSVHVLERGETWSLIETYSSAFHDSAVKNWNTLVQGYVKTSFLKEVVPNQKIGLVIDKLTQRLYIFKDGELYDTLLCSTGLTNAKQPYNETRSGEFLLQTPAVGGWRDGNMYCAMGIRFNSGDILHEVPSKINADGTKNYSSFSAVLGQKASHGCVRVQRVKTPKGTNMTWIWDNRADEMKLVIWEDWQGRQISYPDDDATLYYNPGGGKMYHSAETCYSAVGKTFTPFTYGELEDESFAKLTRCSYCTPPLRKSEIDAINAVYAPGGDHDPVLTEARRIQAEKN